MTDLASNQNEHRCNTRRYNAWIERGIARRLFVMFTKHCTNAKVYSSSTYVYPLHPALAYLPLPNRGDSIGSRRSVDAHHVTRLRCPSIRAMARFRMQDHGYYKMATVTIVSVLLMSARPRYPHPGTNIGIERRDIRMTMTWRGRMVKSIRSMDRNQVVLHPRTLMSTNNLLMPL